MKFALFLSLCIAASLAQAAELYRWVDADGKVHYTDQPPPASAKKVEEKKLSGGTAINTSELPYATQQAMKKSPVTLYANECGEPCKQAHDHLAQRGIPYATKNPQASLAEAEALKKLIGEAVVPVLAVGSTVRKGYQKEAWDAALDAAGYPKSTLAKKGSAPTESATGAAKSESAPVKPAPPHPWAGGR